MTSSMLLSAALVLSACDHCRGAEDEGRRCFPGCYCESCGAPWDPKYPSTPFDYRVIFDYPWSQRRWAPRVGRIDYSIETATSSSAGRRRARPPLPAVGSTGGNKQSLSHQRSSIKQASETSGATNRR